MAKLASSSGFALDFLRRLLCAHSARNAHDPAAAPTSSHLLTPETEPRSPCIVARLMGLDAMPFDAPQAQLTPPLPLRRSRSSSSAEGSPGPWGAQQHHQPRVVRASASLREKPVYLRQESDEFLLLSFSPEDHHHGHDDIREELEFLLAAAESTGRGGRGPGIARKQRKNGYCRKLLFGDDEAESSSRRRRRMPPAECDAQNSSPVSVLQVRDAQEESTTTSSSFEEVEHAEPCSATSDEIQNTLEQQNSNRKQLADFDQFDNPSSARSSCHVSLRCSDRESRNRRIVNKAEMIAPDVTGIWKPICRLVEEDLKNMKWLVQDGANVVTEMESGILDHLIREMMDELVQGRSQNVRPFSLRSKKQLGAKNVQTVRAIGCY